MKKSGLIAFTFIFFSIFAVFFGCALPGTPEKEPQETSKIRVYDIPDGVRTYGRAQVTCEGVSLPLYSVQVNTSQSWSPNAYKRAESGVALIELDGYAVITVKPDVALDYSSKLRPLSARITPVADLQENTLTFKIKSAGNYVLEINGDKDNTINFFVTEYGGFGGADGYKNLIYFGAGLHTAANNGYINADGVVTLNSNTLVYLDDGAVVRAKFVAANASAVAIRGRGIIDGSAFERDAVKGTVTVPIDFNYCTDVSLEDFTVLDPAGWCVNFYFIQNSKIDNIKIITSRSNGDGISLQSCKNITVEGCFVRSWDDSLVVKNYPQWSDRSKHGATENITFKSCTVWTDLAQSLEIGYETVGEKLSGVRFENITILHALHNAAISIHNANNAAVTDIVYEDITIEDAVNPSGGAGIIDVRILYSETWSSAHTVTALGSINNVLIKNLKVVSAKYPSMTIGGCRDVRSGYESDHVLNGLTIDGFSVGGARPSPEELKISSTGYTENFAYITDGAAEVTGASFINRQSEDYLAKFTEGCTVEIVGTPR